MPPMTSHTLRKAPSIAALDALQSALISLRISQSTHPSLATTWKRHASHASQGRANGPKNGPGKRLGAKKSAGEYVIPGNILYKQRGTLWFPGDNCFMVCFNRYISSQRSTNRILTAPAQGRDHTIHAGKPGYVRYYRDPIRHPKRKFIGIVFERDQILPQAPHAVRRRKLGMLAYEMPNIVTEQGTGDLTVVNVADASEQDSTPTIEIREQPRETRREAALKDRQGTTKETKLTLRPGYQYRQSNWEIGRAAERSGTAQSVRSFKRGDRWLAWKKATARNVRNAEKRALGRGGKGGGRKKKRN